MRSNLTKQVQEVWGYLLYFSCNGKSVGSSRRVISTVISAAREKEITLYLLWEDKPC